MRGGFEGIGKEISGYSSFGLAGEGLAGEKFYAVKIFEDVWSVHCRLLVAISTWTYEYRIIIGQSNFDME